eukprot:4739168-Prymnesium_polylepis.2
MVRCGATRRGMARCGAVHRGAAARAVPVASYPLPPTRCLLHVASNPLPCAPGCAAARPAVRADGGGGGIQEGRGARVGARLGAARGRALLLDVRLVLRPLHARQRCARSARSSAAAARSSAKQRAAARAERALRGPDALAQNWRQERGGKRPRATEGHGCTKRRKGQGLWIPTAVTRLRKARCSGTVGSSPPQARGTGMPPSPRARRCRRWIAHATVASGQHAPPSP